MAESEIRQRIEAVKRELRDIREGMVSCTTKSEKDFKILELEDELVELQEQLQAEQKS